MIQDKRTHGEPIVYSKESRDFFLDHLDNIVQGCLDFKESPPTNQKNGDGFQVDVDSIIQSSKITPYGDPIKDVINDFSENILNQSLNFGSPNFLAHPDNGSSMAGLLGDVARGFMQQNLVSYEYSPAATYVEYTILQQIREVIGYKVKNGTTFSVRQRESGFFDNYIFGQNASRETSEGNKDNEMDFSVGLAGGAFVTGGTNANLACLLAAREKLKRKLAQQGKIFNPRKVRVLTKVPYAHYSMRRSALLLGLENNDLSDEQLKDMGLSRNIAVNVKSDKYKMDLYDLEVKINKTLENGEEILSIFAIAGDSRMVSFDDLRGISEIAKKYNIWVHADGCEGGQCLFSPRRRHLLDGIENVNSLSLDPHKVLMVPYNLSIFMLRDIEDMDLIDIGTSLVRLGSLSQGTYTPGIGSKDFGSLRLWFLLKHLGWEKLAEEIDRRHELAKETAAIINASNDFLLINKDVEHNAVAFIFCPKPYHCSTQFNLEVLNKINKQIHHRLNCHSNYYLHMMASQDDDMVVSSEKETLTILRAMYGHPDTNINVVKGCLEEIQKIGYEIFTEMDILPASQEK